MAEQLDPRLENRLRTALRDEADSAPVTLRARELVRLSGERRRRRMERRWSLLASAAVVMVAVGGVAVLAPARPSGPATRTPTGMDTLPSYEQLAEAGAGGAEIARSEGGPIGQDGQWQFGDLHGQPSMEFAIACSGGTVDVSVATSDPGPLIRVGTAACDGAVDLLYLTRNTDVANVAAASAMVNAPPGTAWRMIVSVELSPENLPGTPGPSPSASPFALASYAELEARLVDMSPTMPVVLRGEHADAGPGTTIVTTDLGPVSGIAFEGFAVSCTGGSITVNKMAGDVVLFGYGSACGDSPKLVSDGTDAADPAAHIVVIASERVRWRVVVAGAKAEPSRGPTPQPTVAASPSLPPAGQGETSLVSLDLTAADGTVTRSAARPDGTDEYRLHVACAGDGTLDLSVDGVEGTWACGAVTEEVFVPDWGNTDVQVTAGVTGDARLLLRLDAVDLATLPNVTWLPPVLSISGPDYSAGDIYTVDGFPGCGWSWKPKGGGGFTDDCGPSWQPVATRLDQRPGTSFTVSLPAGWAITGVSAVIARHAAILPSDRAPAETPWTGTASGDTWTFPAPQLGDWGIRLLVSATKDGDAFQVPFYGRIVVTP